MSPSDSDRNVKLIAKSGYPTGQIIVRDSELNIRARGVDFIESDFSPGFYEVVFLAGDSRSAKLIELPVDTTAPVEIRPDELTLSTPVIASATEGATLPTDPAVALSRITPLATNGSGAELFLCIRGVVPGSPSPGEKLKLVDFSQQVIFDFVKAERRGAVVGTVLSVAPGPYILRLEGVGNDCLEQTIYLAENWRTQVFLPMEPLGTGDAPARPNLCNAAVLTSFRGRPFDPTNPQHGWVETARQDLAAGRGIVPEQELRRFISAAQEMRKFAGTSQQAFGEQMRLQCVNPMLGIYAAHLMMASDTPLSGSQQDLLAVVADNLHVLVGDHPDVLAIYLWLDPKASWGPFRTPPMLRSSWAVFVNRSRRSRRREDLVPSGSYSARIADRLWGAGAWLTWSRPEPLATEMPGGVGILKRLGAALRRAPLITSLIAANSKDIIKYVRAALNVQPSASALVEKETDLRHLTPLERTLLAQAADLVEQEVHLREILKVLHGLPVLGAVVEFYYRITGTGLFQRAQAAALDLLSTDKLVTRLGVPQAAVSDAVASLTQKLKSASYNVSQVAQPRRITGDGSPSPRRSSGRRRQFLAMDSTASRPSQPPVIEKAPSLKDIQVRTRDDRGVLITCVYAVEGDIYAIYQAGEVMVHFADDPAKAQAQRKSILPISSARAEINALAEGLAHREVYDRQLAYALQLALDGDMDGAKTTIAAAKTIVLERRAARGRFQYLNLSFGAAAVMIGLLFLASRLFPFHQTSSNLLWLAGEAGLVGAAFSIALAIRNRTVAPDTYPLDNLTDATLRLVIGVISAGVLLLLFTSGIMPRIKIGDANFGGDTLTWQMVLVIGFLGGFMERLVPDLWEKRNPQRNGNAKSIAGAAGSAVPAELRPIHQD